MTEVQGRQIRVQALDSFWATLGRLCAVGPSVSSSGFLVAAESQAGEPTRDRGAPGQCHPSQAPVPHPTKWGSPFKHPGLVSGLNAIDRSAKCPVLCMYIPSPSPSGNPVSPSGPAPPGDMVPMCESPAS